MNKHDPQNQEGYTTETSSLWPRKLPSATVPLHGLPSGDGESGSPSWLCPQGLSCLLGPSTQGHLEFSGKRKPLVSTYLNSILESDGGLVGTVCERVNKRRRTVVCRRPGQSRYPGTAEESRTYLSGVWGDPSPFETSRRCLTWARSSACLSSWAFHSCATCC